MLPKSLLVSGGLLLDLHPGPSSWLVITPLPLEQQPLCHVSPYSSLIPQTGPGPSYSILS